MAAPQAGPSKAEPSQAPKNDDEIIQALLVHEKKSAPAIVPGGASEEESSSSDSEAETSKPSVSAPAGRKSVPNPFCSYWEICHICALDSELFHYQRVQP